MSKIIISSEEKIACPKCSNQFALRLGITQQTIDRYRTEYDSAFAQESKELEERLQKEAERKANKNYTDQIAQLTQALQESNAATLNAKDEIAKAQVEAKTKARAEAEQATRALVEELQEKTVKVKELQDQELQLRVDKRKLEEAQESLKLEVQRQLDQERKVIQQQVAAAESEKFNLREAELRKQIDDAKKANEDLARKLAQGSQQLQGEVLEIEIENLLTDTFRHDKIQEVKKGQRGADVLHTVCTPSGQTCGTIIWEAKRAENWSEKWLTKLKDDQLEAKADISVLVTTAMPKNQCEPFYIAGDVWVVAPHCVKPLAETLRILLLEAYKLKLTNTGRDEKMELLYNYLSGAQFAQKVRTMLESFESMRSDLEAEKRAYQKIWAKRQAQIERVTGSMISVVGELQGIAHDALPQLEAIDLISLPSGKDVDLNDL